MQYVRGRADGSVFVGHIDGMVENDARNAEFRKVHGLSDAACMSFESTMFPGRYLRHSSDAIRLVQKPWFSAAFNDAATFCMKVPLGGGLAAYEAYSKKNWFIRADGGMLVLRLVSYSSQYPADYNAVTFFEKAGPITLGLHNFGSLSAAPATYTSGDYHVVRYNGTCTGITLPFATPQTKSVIWTLQYSSKELTFPQTRTVTAVAVGSPFTGFCPFVDLYLPLEPGMNFATQQGPVARIVTGVFPCLL